MSGVDHIKEYYEGKVEPIYRAITGTTLHLAMIEAADESHAVGTLRTKAYLASRLSVQPGDTLIDLGSGYGDATRYLAQRFDCRVVALNLIHVQNVFATNLIREATLDAQVDILEGDFACVPVASGCAQAAWCQESLLHAPQRGRVLEEAVRLLRSGGQFVFTDILQTGPMEPEEARLIYARVKIDSLESFESYQEHIRAAGLLLEEVADLSRYVAPYYQDLANTFRRNRAALDEAVGPDFVDYTIQALERWVTAAQEGKLGWGMFLARKP